MTYTWRSRYMAQMLNALLLPESRMAHLADLGKYLLGKAQANVYAGGVPFVPLSPARARQKARLGMPLTPLIATGRLWLSLSPGGPDNIFEVDGWSGRFGTSREWAAAHQYGEGVPRRAFLIVEEEDLEEIGDRTVRWLLD